MSENTNVDCAFSTIDQIEEQCVIYKFILVNIYLVILIQNSKDTDKLKKMIDLLNSYLINNDINIVINIDNSYDTQYYKYYDKICNYIQFLDKEWLIQHNVIKKYMFNTEGRKIEPSFQTVLVEAYHHNPIIFGYLLKINEINPNVSFSVDSKNYYAGYSLIIHAMVEFDINTVKMILNHPKFDKKYQDCDMITPYMHVFHNKLSIKNCSLTALNSLVEESNRITNAELYNTYMSMFVHTSPSRLPTNKRIRYIDETHESESDSD